MSRENPDWRGLFARHRGAVALFALACALAFAGAVYVFLWFVAGAQSSGLVPSTLGLWTMADLVSFVLHAVFWELLLVGVPSGVAALLAWAWWRRLPAEEKRGYRFGGRSRSAGGGGVSLVLFVGFCVKVYLDGNWNVAIGSFTLDYVVGSALLVLAWLLAVVGIPVAVGTVWWIRRGKKSPEPVQDSSPSA